MKTVTYRQEFLHREDGASLYYDVVENGRPTLVLCDGLGCDGFAWKYLQPALSQHYSVLHWNYRGHGYSTVGDDETHIGMQYIFEDLDAILTKEKTGPCVVFGHSMGVQVALEFQKRFAHHVSALVLLCGSYGHPLDTWHDHTLARRMFPLIEKIATGYTDLASLVVRAIVPSRLGMWFALTQELNPQLMNERDFKPYLEHLARMNPRHFFKTLASLQEHSAYAHLPKIDVPALVVGGEIDKFTPAWLSKRMATRIKNCELLLVPGGSHTAPLERPDMVNDAVLQFLASHRGQIQSDEIREAVA